MDPVSGVDFSRGNVVFPLISYQIGYLDLLKKNVSIIIPIAMIIAPIHQVRI